MTKREKVRKLYTEMLNFYKAELGSTFIFPSKITEEELVGSISGLFGGLPMTEWKARMKEIMDYHDIKLTEEQFSSVYPKTVHFLRQFLNFL